MNSYLTSFLSILIYMNIDELLYTIKCRFCSSSVWLSNQVTYRKLSLHSDMFNFMAITNAPKSS